MIHQMAHDRTEPHETPETANRQHPKFLSINEVAERVCMSRRTIYTRLNDPESDFPRPVYLHERRIVFVEAEITEWQLKLMEARQ